MLSCKKNVQKTHTNFIMSTRLVICDELAKKANSKLVKYKMLVHYQQEFQAIFNDQEVLSEKVTEVSNHMNRMAKLIKELQLLCSSDSSIESIFDLRRMQHEDLAEGARLMLLLHRSLCVFMIWQLLSRSCKLWRFDVLSF